MKIHYYKMTPNEYGGFTTSTFCGRMHRESKDGMNSTNDWSEVTCKFCLNLKAAEKAA